MAHPNPPVTHPLSVGPDRAPGAYERLRGRIQAGIPLYDQLLDRVAALHIRDRLVPPTSMRFVGDGQGVFLTYPDEEGANYRIHRHAFAQLAQRVKLPISYANFLQAEVHRDPWKGALLAHNLNELYANTKFTDRSGSPKFLHRCVGQELRGFLSRRFNRMLASLPLLRGFVAACAGPGALPIDARAGDVKFSLKCALPIVFEVGGGQFVALGVEWSNSDFGAGRMQVALCLWLSATGATVVLEQALSRVHIGSVMDDSDVEVSEETAQKEAEAQVSAIRDAVEAQLSPDYVSKVVRALGEAAEAQVPWGKLRSQLAHFLTKKELETLEAAHGIEALPPVAVGKKGEVLVSPWWAAAALGYLAQSAADPTRADELERKSGEFLEVPSAGGGA